MLSRIADSLFWLNRYMERTDSLVRLIYVHYILSLDKGISSPASWRQVLEVSTRLNTFDIGWIEHNTPAALHKLMLDSENNNSLKILVHRARENARGTQDYITKEVWEEVNQTYHYMNEPTLAEKLCGSSALEVLDKCITHAVLFAGLTDNTMARNTGWYFMNLGKYIERCFHTIALLEKQLQLIHFNIEEPGDILQWRYLLLALSGYELHLKTYTSTHHTANLLHQVIFNENFTRSILYSLNRIDIYLGKVMPTGSSIENKSILKRFGRLYSEVKYKEQNSLNNNNLHQFLSDVRDGLADFSTQFAQHFFSYA
jgi:uncharacterized alpha-E superfamily protein